VFGISLTEVALIAMVALVVVGPQKLPGMLRTLGQWVRKLRRLTTEVRQQTGIDDILREEGIHGGLTELRGLLRGGGGYAPAYRPPPMINPYSDDVEIDRTREYPPEGVDAYGALPDDLVADEPATDLVSPSPNAPASAPVAPAHAPAAPKVSPSSEST
jgi:sec-independent protein translocase protein TatB